MKISVFTPSHNPTWLSDVWQCLLRQRHQDWEWVVVPNGEERERVRLELNRLTDGDSRVVQKPLVSDKIGALKRYACEQSTGDLLLELDHDDLITDDCLSSVAAVATANPGKAFIYSDDVTLNEDKTSRCFIKEYGWKHYIWRQRGIEYHVNHQFPATPRVLADILYAPDHVRVWTRDAYFLAGGHDKNMRVGDDHELLVRTYLKGVPFYHIDRPLYIHRLRNDGTCESSVQEITYVSMHTRNRYMHQLVAEWCRRGSLPMYDLGGAHNCPDGYTAVDQYPSEDDPDRIVCNVMDGLPLKPNSVGCFRAYDFLEHIPPQRVPWLLNHLYDLLVPGGWLLTHTPAVCDDQGRTGRGAFQDPTHVSYWSSNNWWYYTDRNFAKYVPEIRCRFQTVRLFNWYPSDWHATHLIPYVCADLAALKDGIGYWPGPQLI